MEKKERIAALDLIRGVSMLSVVVLHVTSGFVFLPAGHTLFGMNLAFLLNQAVRYCVPLFFLLSGFSLEYAYRGQRVGRFLKARMGKILIPYLLWTLIYYVDGLPPMKQFDFTTLLQHVLQGTAAPQLYFIVALVQLYILFVPLHKLLQRHAVVTLSAVFLLSFFVQWAIYLTVFDIQMLPTGLRPHMIKTFFPWLFAFLFGMFLAQKQPVWRKTVSEYWPVWLLLTLCFGVFYCADSWATGTFDLSVKPILFLYVPLVFFCLYGVGEKLMRLRPVSVVARFLSGRSMTVFFCHVFILNHLRAQAVYRVDMKGMLLALLIVTALSLLFAFAFDHIAAVCKRLLFKPRAR